MVATKILESGMTILIHDDYCCNVKETDIPQILTQIGMIISHSYNHSEVVEADVLNMSQEMPQF